LLPSLLTRLVALNNDMGMTASRKKYIPFSAYDRPRLDIEHPTRARASKKVLDASNHIPTSNPEPTNIVDPPTMTDESKLVARAVSYTLTKYHAL